MYPSDQHQHHHHHQQQRGRLPPSNLARYGSAPGSLLTSMVDSVMSDGDFSSSVVRSDDTTNTNTPTHSISRYFPDSSSKVNLHPDLNERAAAAANNANGSLQRSSSSSSSSFTINQSNQISLGPGPGHGPSPAQLIRHSSSPAGFFNHLMVDNNGFSVTRGIGRYGPQAGSNGHGIANGRLKSQLSFTRQDSLSQISEVSENLAGGSSSADGARHAGPSYTSGGFPMGSWEESNTIMFSSPPNKRDKNIDEDILAALNSVDSQSQFGLRNVEKLLHMQPDSVPCKIRAKRGCATHPRSIAERERRTRISEKLRKLQELVPNMDKQTSTADMLELAVQHIKGLQSEIQKLNKDLEHCSCGCKQAAT